MRRQLNHVIAQWHAATTVFTILNKWAELFGLQSVITW